MDIVAGRLPIQFDRKFHLGDYDGSHAQLLFRSGRTGYHRGEGLKYDSVVDILFKNVGALAIVENYYPLEVSLGGDRDESDFSRLLNCEIGNRSLYILRGEDSVGYVLAGAMYWIDDGLGSTDEPSVLTTEPLRSGTIKVVRA